MKITVTGNSQMTLPAECVAVSLSAGFTGSDRAAVVTDTAALLERLRARLDDAVADGRGRDVRLSSLRTWTSVGDDRRGRVRHVAEVRGSFVLDDLSTVGPLLGELAGIDGVQIGNLEWQLTDETLKAIQPDVLKAAFTHAVQRAEWIAAAAGLGTVEAVAIRDDAPPRFARPMMARAMMADSAAPSIDLDPEDVDVSVILNVDFDAR
ncbi:MAG: SIMPL domain-containing protein [Tessaracoccus sp.]|uniref:SIMPL domain-containing protein n=1 Tax=Tessaracoccus sp. TaxID=1971211 RepID=UPI001EC2493F|nr:SIMPL domain-containing protein [Tessaracoccus sp.]MBK7822153.1 SIMPL domain-containing protein [Tessaracoccus sp.]